MSTEIPKDTSQNADRDDEALESEHLASVERDYAAEQRCPCCFTPECAGVPLNPNPELIHEEEKVFSTNAYARASELLQTPFKETAVIKGPSPS